MARTPAINVSGAVLQWARKQRGLSIETVAKRARLSSDKISAIENGQDKPSLAQLRRLAEIYKRPLIVLLLDEAPTSFQALTDYRLLPDAQRSVYSPELLDEIHRAELQREAYVDLAALLDRPVLRPNLPAATVGPDVLAASLRQLLGVSAAKQRSLRDKEKALSFWRSQVEELGILVLEASRISLSEMRGFSLSDKDPFVIVLNGEDEPRGKVFTLLHELCHLCLRQPGVCDLRSTFNRTGDQVETYCNRVAGAVLLPEAMMRQLHVVRAHPQGQEWADFELVSIRNEAGGASQEAILRRLVQLGLASRDEYEAKREQYLVDYEGFRRRRSQRSKGGPPPYRMQLRDRGRPFVRSVLDAYGEGYLTLSDVSDLVGLRVKHLDNLQREAFR